MSIVEMPTVLPVPNSAANVLPDLFRFGPLSTWSGGSRTYSLTKFQATLRVTAWQFVWSPDDKQWCVDNHQFPTADEYPKYVLVDRGYTARLSADIDAQYQDGNVYGFSAWTDPTSTIVGDYSQYDVLTGNGEIHIAKDRGAGYVYHHYLTVLPLRVIDKKGKYVRFSFSVPNWLNEKLMFMHENDEYIRASWLIFQPLAGSFDLFTYTPSLDFRYLNGLVPYDTVVARVLHAAHADSAADLISLLADHMATYQVFYSDGAHEWKAWPSWLAPLSIDQNSGVPAPILNL